MTDSPDNETYLSGFHHPRWVKGGFNIVSFLNNVLTKGYWNYVYSFRERKVVFDKIHEHVNFATFCSCCFSAMY